MNTLGLILATACLHGMAHWWYENTYTGYSFRKFCQEWRTDSFVHLLLCGGTVFILSCCAILALGLACRILGI